MIPLVWFEHVQFPAPESAKSFLKREMTKNLLLSRTFAKSHILLLACVLYSYIEIFSLRIVTVPKCLHANTQV